MIDLSQHFEYIGGAYLITCLLVGALVFLVNRDYHTQEKRLSELEAKGIRRRSQETPKG
ncbi:heme exporter protein CcmD [Maritalea sp.]|uniref:heme exporter protein CcmD n=1 Tax=Maritalea sp. TaxID=2003361 RepID=UPI003EF1581A